MMELELTCPKCEKPYRVEVEASQVSALMAGEAGECGGCRYAPAKTLNTIKEAILALLPDQANALRRWFFHVKFDE